MLFRVFAGLLLFVVAMTGGLAALRFRSIDPKLSSCMNAAAAGVFLASAMVHMLPEAAATLSELWGGGAEAPWGGILSCIGFLSVLLLDHGSMLLQHRKEWQQDKEDEQREYEQESNPSSEEGDSSSITTALLRMSELPMGQEPQQQGRGGLGGDEATEGDAGHADDEERLFGATAAGDGDTAAAATVGDAAAGGGGQNGSSLVALRRGEDAASHGGMLTLQSTGAARRSLGQQEDTEEEECLKRMIQRRNRRHQSRHHHHHHHQHGVGGAEDGLLTTLALVLALCFHSVMEGLGLGAGQERMWTVLFAILAHKGLAAYALISAITAAEVHKSGGLSTTAPQALASRHVGLLVLFSSMTPLGICIGYFIGKDGDGAASAVCMALAAGTFLYVALMEVLPNELQSPRHGPAKLGALLAGFMVSALVALGLD